MDQALHNIDASMICPITQVLMEDPVQAEDEITYERAAIEHHFQLNRRSVRSPSTNLPMGTRLVPNRTLKSLIDSLRDLQAAGGGRRTEDAEMAVDSEVIVRVTDVLPGMFQVFAESTGPIKSKNGVVLVLDTSGSMADPASKQGEGSNWKCIGLVEHAAKAVAKMLEKGDEFAIVEFNSNARVVKPFAKMGTPEAYERAANEIETLDANGSTNLWGGLKSAIALSKAKMATGDLSHVSIILLTDGEPDDGNVPKEFRAQLKEALGNSITLHTCAAGVNARSDMLAEMAECGQGLFTFIADGSMVGTVFTHLVAIIQTTLFHRVNMHCSTADGEIVTYPIGTLRAGIPFYVKCPPGSTIRGISSGNQDLGFVAQTSVVSTSGPRMEERFAFLDTLIEASNLSARGGSYVVGAREKMVRFMDTVVDPVLKNDIFSTNSDKGQICKAFDSMNSGTRSWGPHYLRMLICALQRQVKVNYKDEMLEFHSCPSFEAVVGRGEVIFKTIPIPDPKSKAGQISYSTTYTRSAARGGACFQAASVSALFSAGCFSGDTRILMGDHTAMAMSDLRPGMKVYGGYKILRVLKSYGDFTVMKCGDLWVTEWHPCRLREDTEWFMPHDHKQWSLLPVQESVVYNLVLNTGHTITGEFKEGVAVTLGHGKTGPVVGHAFFGNFRRVMKNLDRLPKCDGVSIATGAIRDPRTNLVSAFVYEPYKAVIKKISTKTPIFLHEPVMLAA